MERFRTDEDFRLAAHPREVSDLGRNVRKAFFANCFRKNDQALFAILDAGVAQELHLQTGPDVPLDIGKPGLPACSQTGGVQLHRKGGLSCPQANDRVTFASSQFPRLPSPLAITTY